MTTRVDESARLPEVPLQAIALLPAPFSNYVRTLDEQLHWLFRDMATRHWAVETTLGLVPRKPSTVLSVSSNGMLKVTGSFSRSVVTETTTARTVLTTDNHIICNNAGTVTLTLPSAATYSGRELYVRTITAATVVSASSNVVPLAGGAAGTAILAATAGKWALLVSDSSNWQIMAGN